MWDTRTEECEFVYEYESMFLDIFIVMKLCVWRFHFQPAGVHNIMSQRLFLLRLHIHDLDLVDRVSCYCTQHIHIYPHIRIVSLGHL